MYNMLAIGLRNTMMENYDEVEAFYISLAF